MKRKITWICIAVTFGLVTTGLILLSNNQDDTSQTFVASHNQPARAIKVKSACSVFTELLAQKVLGGHVQKPATPPVMPAGNDSVWVTTCSYETANDASASVATVLLRAARYHTAFSTNVMGFTSTREASFEHDSRAYQNVSHLGTAAYYNASFKQVHVLVGHGHYWAIVQVDGGSEKAISLARAIVAAL